MTSLYDTPAYYDILFGWDRDREAASYDAIFRDRVSPDRRARIVEMGAGTGQIAIRLARLGWPITALDVSPAMLAFAAATAAGVPLDTLCVDMRDFTVAERFDAALCPLGTFAMLPDDASAVAHLRAAAAALAPGAPYVLDLTLTESPGEPASPGDSWSMQRDGVEVQASPQEIVVIDPELPAPLALTWGPPLHEYDPRGLTELVARAGGFRVVGHHPEAGTVGDEDVSVFDETCRPGLPPNRGLIVLQRLA